MHFAKSGLFFISSSDLIWMQHTAAFRLLNFLFECRLRTVSGQLFQFNHSFILHSFISSFIHFFISSFIHSFIHACMHACMHAFIHAFIHSFINSFRQTDKWTFSRLSYPFAFFPRFQLEQIMISTKA